MEVTFHARNKKTTIKKIINDTKVEPHQLKKNAKRKPLKQLDGNSKRVIPRNRNGRKKSIPTVSTNNIIVSLRVRPVLKYEKKSTTAVTIKKSTIGLQNPKSGFTKYFSYDRVFNSSKKFEKDQTQFCSQIVNEILNNTNQGYNSCAFCYGQTGSGKTYTLHGTLKAPGILPRVCKGLFSIIEKNEKTQRPSNSLEAEVDFNVSISMIELYNDNIKDLFHPAEKYLRILDNGEIMGLESISVYSYEEVMNLISQANKVKQMASTKMNDRSSRSHTIVQIKFTQTFSYMGDEVKRLCSVLNLIDLAGSERTKKANTSGMRQKEGISINESLTHLGICINKLAKSFEKKSKGGSLSSREKVHIPYRNSKLTFLLKNSLSGNSRTYVIVNVSPSGLNFEETKSSLEFASRVKQIETSAKINEDINLKRKREQFESEKLIEMQNTILDLQRKNEEEIKHLKQMWADEMQTFERLQLDSFDQSISDLKMVHQNEIKKRDDRIEQLENLLEAKVNENVMLMEKLKIYEARSNEIEDKMDLD